MTCKQVFRKCENCKRKPSEETLNHNGDFYFLCKKCYVKIKYV